MLLRGSARRGFRRNPRRAGRPAAWRGRGAARADPDGCVSRVCLYFVSPLPKTGRLKVKLRGRLGCKGRWEGPRPASHGDVTCTDQLSNGVRRPEVCTRMRASAQWRGLAFVRTRERAARRGRVAGQHKIDQERMPRGRLSQALGSGLGMGLGGAAGPPREPGCEGKERPAAGPPRASAGQIEETCRPVRVAATRFKLRRLHA